MRLAAYSGLCVLLVSCVSTGTTVLNPALRHPPVTQDKVVIYTSKDKVPGAFEEIAILSSQGAYTVASDAVFYESFRKEAAKIGANGVIITPIEDPTTGQKVGSAVLGALLIPNTMANRKTQATAIYVLPKPLSDQEVAAEAARREARLAKLDAFETSVRAGVSRDALLEAVGAPDKSTTNVNGNGESTETAIYLARTGTRFEVVLKNSVIVRITKR